MKVTFNRSKLAEALKAVKPAIPSRTPKDILKNCKLTVGGGQATLIGTDQEVGIRYNVTDCEASSPGEALLPFDRFSAIVRELPDDTVQVEGEDGNLYVRGTGSKFTLQTEDPAEFPDVEGFPLENYHVIKAASLGEMIRRTIFATEDNDTRYALGGILLDRTADTLTLAATDSRRLAVTSAPAIYHGEEPAEWGQPVIPAKAMILIERSLPDGDDAAIAVRPNDVLVKSEVVTIYSRLIDGRFPRYRNVIPDKCNARVEVTVEPFHAAVRQAMIVSDAESRGVDFSFGYGSLTLSSMAASVGRSTIETAIANDNGKVDLTIDPWFVADFLKVLEPDAPVTIRLVDGKCPVVFTTGDGYLYLVMPLARKG